MISEENAVLALFDREIRHDNATQTHTREASPRIVRHIPKMDNVFLVTWSNLDESNVDEEIEAQTAFAQEHGFEFEWKVFDHDQPSDLRERLKSHGYEIDEPEALMILDLQNAPDFYWTLQVPEIVLIDSMAGVHEVAKLEEEVWGENRDGLETFLKYDLQNNPENLKIFAARVNGRVASAAWIYFYPPTAFAGLWGGSTLKDYRGRGFYTGLLAARAREARQRGVRYLMVDASKISRPILEKHGFQFYEYSTPCILKPSRNAE